MGKAQQLVKKFKALKTLPHIAIRLSQMISDDKTTAKDLEEVIRLDPTLVMRLIKLINSPFYGLVNKVDSISMAIVYLGMENLRNMIVVEALKDIFKKGKDEHVFSRNKLWLHSAVVGICSQMISERIFQLKSEDAFLCGILHDIGMIVEDQTTHDEFLKVCQSYKPNTKSVVEYEKHILGTDHSEVGSLVAQDWKLPPEVQKGIKRHHKDMKDIAPDSISGIIQLSEFMVSKLEYTALPNMNAVLSPPLRTHVHDKISDYKTILRDLPEEITKAREIYQNEKTE